MVVDCIIEFIKDLCKKPKIFRIIGESYKSSGITGSSKVTGVVIVGENLYTIIFLDEYLKIYGAMDDEKIFEYNNPKLFELLSEYINEY